jgi:hypothetical protein
MGFADGEQGGPAMGSAVRRRDRHWARYDDGFVAVLGRWMPSVAPSGR